MVYDNTRKRFSGFTKYNDVNLNDRAVGTKDGGNSNFPIQAIIDKVAEVYGGSFRVYELESELVASDIQLGEYALVEESGYAFYKITNDVVTGNNIALTSGLTAKYESSFVKSATDYDDLRSKLTVEYCKPGDTVTLASTTNTGINGVFVVVPAGSYLDDGFSIITGGSLAAVLINNYDSEVVYASLAEATASERLKVGMAVNLIEHSIGNRGGGVWDIKAAGPADNGYNIREHDTLPLVAVFRVGETIETNQIGSTLDDALVQAAIDTGAPNVVVTAGDWVYSNSVILRANLNLIYSPKAETKPSADGLVLVSTDPGSFTDVSPVLTPDCKVFNFRFSFDGFNNCTGIKVGNFRDNTGIYTAYGTCQNNGTGNRGIDFDILNWNTTLENCYMRSGFDKSYVFSNGSNAITLLNCKGNVADTHILITNGTYATENVQVLGGFYQRARVNIEDRGVHTVINGVYLERPSEADIFFNGASAPVVQGAVFTGGEDAPSSGIKARNTFGAAISGAYNSSNRTGPGLFDFDSSNEYCFASNQRSATLGTLIGDITGLKMKTNFVAADAVTGDIGVDNNQIVGRQGSQILPLANNHDRVLVLPALNINMDNYFGISRKNVSGDTAFTISGTPIGGQSFKLVLFTTVNLTANTITVDGRDLDTSSATGGNRTCTVEYTYTSDLARWVTGPVKWEVS